MGKSSSLNKRKAKEEVSDGDICGTCGDNINIPKFPVNSHPDLSQQVITCSNLRKKCCKSVTIGEISPHHHLGCVCRAIPKESKIYSGIIQYVEARQSKKFIPNPFLCDYCNVQGSEQYLLEYFMNFRKLKKMFYNDDEAIDSIPPISLERLESDDIEDSGTASERGFVTHVIKNKDDMPSLKQTEITLKNIRNILQNISYKSGVIQIEGLRLTQNCLLGQPIRLYCTITRSYHSGRIIDSRIVDTSYQKRLKEHNKSFLQNTGGSESVMDDYERLQLDLSVGFTQYLVRFRAGLDGRKVALHQWLFLEEHPVMVGVATVWVKVPTVSDSKNENGQMSDQTSSKDDNCTGEIISHHTGSKKDKSVFRPAKIYVRTALELNNIYKGETNTVKAPEGKTYDACAICYGREDSHVFLKLVKDAPLDITNDDKDVTFDDIEAADLHAPPERLLRHLRSIKAHEESLVENISAALMDEEEKQRIIEGHVLVKLKAH